MSFSPDKSQHFGQSCFKKPRPGLLVAYSTALVVAGYPSASLHGKADHRRLRTADDDLIPLRLGWKWLQLRAAQ